MLFVKKRYYVDFRFVDGVAGAAGCADGVPASETSSQDALHLLRRHCEGVRRSQPPCHCVSRLPL